MILTQEEIQRRAAAQQVIGKAYEAASQAKGRPLSDNEMLKVREMHALGRSLEEIAKEFTPPLTPREQTSRELLDAFSRAIARLTDDMTAQGLIVRQLEEEVGQLHEEIAALKRASAPARKH